MKIMLSISNEPERETLGILLKQKGADVLFGDADFTTIQKATQASVDIIVLEYISQNDPIRLLSLISKNPRLNKTPIILYGAPVDARTKTNLMGAGARKILSKPLILPEFFEELHIPNSQESKSVGIYVQSESVRSLSGEVTLFNTNPEVSELILQNQTSEKAKTHLCPSDEQLKILELAKKNPVEALNQMVKRVEELFAFPFTVTKILELVNDPTSSASDLGNVISSDTAISAALLRASNSVEYAGRGRRISDVNEAVVRLGFNETKKISVSASVMTLCDQEDKSLGFNRMEFWYHSLAVAVLCESLAEKQGFKKPTTAFTCGLLHEIGLMVLDEFFNVILNVIMDKAAQANLTVLDAEMAVLGFTHTNMAYELFQLWKLPGELARPIQAHMEYENPVNGLSPEEAELARILGVANKLSNLCGIGQLTDMRLCHFSTDTLSKLHCAAGIHLSIVDEAMKKVKGICNTMHISVKNYPENWLPGLAGNPFMLVELSAAGQSGLPMVLQSQGLILKNPASTEDGSIMRFQGVIVSVDESFSTDSAEEEIMQKIPKLWEKALLGKFPLFLIAPKTYEGFTLKDQRVFFINRCDSLSQLSANLIRAMVDWQGSN